MMKSVIILGLLIAAVLPEMPGREKRRDECKSMPVVTVAYSGLFEITALDGSLTLRKTGVNTPQSGGGRNIASVASVVSGSGRFAGVTGTVFFNGINVTPGIFSTEVTGELCFAGGGS